MKLSTVQMHGCYGLYQMKHLAFIIITIFFTSGCNETAMNSAGLIPEMMQPNWTGIDIEKFPVKFGQVLIFGNDTNALTAIVLDFREDEGGQWIGVCFINQNRIFGRQIPGGMINTYCLDLVDLTYIHRDALVDYKILDTIKVNKSKVGIGAQSPATNFAEIERDFKLGLEQRKKEQTPCDKEITNLNPVRECYFGIDKIKYQ